MTTKDSMPKSSFPAGFVWGCATSSYQIEGAISVAGRGESIWDRFARVPGAIEDASDGSEACQHYHRYREDVGLMAELGLKAYRFSIAWPRILPHGTGAVNQAGLDFYSRLVDELMQAGIRPFATLYHWDMPQALQDQGGWPERSTTAAFVEYADAVTRSLGDRVKDWITHNEPWCISVLGHETGEHAPGVKHVPDALATAHHLLLSHGLAVPVIRANSKGCEVGITLNLCAAEAASPSAADAKACRAFDGWFNRWYLDPLYGRGYPKDVVAKHQHEGHLPAAGIPFVQAGDLEIIATTTDFIGVNYYSRGIIRSDAVSEAENEKRTVHRAPKSEDTDMGWEVYPKGLRDTLSRVHSEYGAPKIYVTECGAAYDTAPDDTGRVQDRRRLNFLRDHFEATQAALGDGVPVGGFFVWSLFDNFEWAFGYKKRFGIVWVDYDSQKRIPKASAIWYRDVIANNGFADLEQVG
jgi:beta-glucosidase